MQAAGWGGVGSVASQSDQISYSRSFESFPINACANHVDMRLYSGLSTPRVLCIRMSAAATPSVDALSGSSPDDFDIPAFLRKRVDSTDEVVSPPVLRTKVSKPVQRALGVGPLATPIDLLKTFDNLSQKLLAPHRFVRELQALNLPPELTKLLDDLTAILGSGTKAWALVLQWLVGKLGDQITLSRQSERLLRHALKDEDVKKLEEMLLPLVKDFTQATSDDWHLASTMAL